MLERVVKAGETFRLNEHVVHVGERSDPSFDDYTLPLRINGVAVVQTGTKLTALVHGCNITARPRRGRRARLVFDAPQSIRIRFGVAQPP